ncbi:hypothetical protein LTR41_000128 [Exophiala xenobiotica]|nr:hypothetical protein LTR41_000128 [Exophiala xenobiotica]
MSPDPPDPPRNRRGFKIAVICALSLEADAVHAVFDKFWTDDHLQPTTDYYTCTTGSIGLHNVVLAYMSGMGKANASGVAASLRSSFPDIKLALIVGICGGVPSTGADGKGGEIYLGDVIFSTALIQQTFGWRYPKELQTKDTTKDSLGRPNLKIHGVFTKLETTYYREQLQKSVAASLKKIQEKMPGSKYPGSEADILFEPSYLHKHHDSFTGTTVTCDQCSAGPDDICEDALKMTCENLGCDEMRIVDRHKATDVKASSEQHAVSVHFGVMGSGDTVMKSGQHRDRLAKDFGIIAFEMEGAGVWDHFPSIVVKGVCDYADGHKNKNWQRYAAATAAAGMKAFLEQWALEANDQEEPPPPVVWHVPFNQPGNFRGRKKVLAILEDSLFQPPGRPPSRVALFGLGGMGKSITAVELAYATRNQRPTYSVFWVEATDHLTFEKDFLEIGKKLNIPGIEDEKADVKNLVKQYLSQDSAGNWLMILDNADDEGIWGVPAKSSANGTALAESLPKCTTGRILVTTRSLGVAVYMAGKEAVELPEMNQEEAVETFLGLLRKPEARMDAERISKLVETLTYLPLAIVQAAAYLNMNDAPTQHYLEFLGDTEENVIALLSEDFSNDEQRYRKGQNPVASTWIISFNQMRVHHPRAADLLAFTSCLGEKNIPSSLLPEASSKIEMTEALGILIGYSFLRKQHEDQNQSKEAMYQTHRLVRLATRNWLRTQDTLLHWTQMTARVVVERFPMRRHDNRDQCALYMPHAQVLCTSDGIEDFEERYVLLEKIDLNFLADGKYSEAVRLHASVVSWRETKLGPSHISTLRAYRYFGAALNAQGDWSEAKTYLEKAVEGHNQILGAEHEDTLMCVSDLVETFAGLGDWEEAEELGEQVTRTRTKFLGAEHPETLASMADLVWIYTNQKQYQKAVEFGLLVVQIRRKLLGEEHPDTLASMADLAAIYSTLGRLKEAEELQTIAMQTQVRILGGEHPSLLRNMGNLALTYERQGRLEETERLKLKALEIAERLLGFENHLTLTAMYNLASTWREQDRLKEADALMERCITLSIKKLGYHHPTTQERLSNWPRFRFQEGEGDHEELELDPLPQSDNRPQLPPEYHDAWASPAEGSHSQTRGPAESPPGGRSTDAFGLSQPVLIEKEPTLVPPVDVPYTDSGDVSVPKNEFDRHGSLGPVESDDALTEYSDASSIADTKRNAYICELADDLYGKVDIGAQTRNRVNQICEDLPSLLKVFALRIGHGGSTQMHRDVMYFVHRHHREISDRFKSLCMGQNIPGEAVNDPTSGEGRDQTDQMLHKERMKRRHRYQGQMDDPTADTGFAEDDPVVQLADDPDDQPEQNPYSLYAELIAQTSAHDWLLDSLRKQPYLTPTDSTRNPRRHPPETYQMEFSLMWDPLHFTQEQGYTEKAEEVIKYAITLTGNMSQAQAMPCGQYLSQMWPSSGPAVLQMVQDALREPGAIVQAKLSDDTKLQSSIDGPHFKVQVSGIRDSIAEVGEQLAWLGSAVRSATDDNVALCSPFIENIAKNGPDGPTIETSPNVHTCHIQFRTYQHGAYPTINNGRCWHDMFRNPTIVEGFPILWRPENMPGLEIPLNMMAALIQTRRIDTFNDIPYIKGFSSMLYPTKSVDDFLLWHHLFNKDGNRIPFTDERITGACYVSRFDLPKARHIVGWCSEVEYRAGSANAMLSIEKAGLRTPYSGCVLEKVTLTGGLYVTAGFDFRMGNKDKAVHILRDGYREKLQLMDQRSEFRFDPKNIKEPDVLNAPGSALEVLRHPENRTLPLYTEAGHHSCFEERVDDLCNQLIKILDHQYQQAGQNGLKLKPSLRHRLEGWDFTDLAMQRDHIRPCVADTPTMRRGWFNFVREIQAIVLFGHGFGEILRPSAKSKISCPHWTRLPHDTYYLAAAVADLHTIMKYEGSPNADPPRLTRTIAWHQGKRSWKDFQCKPRACTTHPEFVQALLAVKHNAGNSNSKSSSKPTVDPQDAGAVVFGHNKIRWFNSNKGLSRQGTPPRPGEEPTSPVDDSGVGTSLGTLNPSASASSDANQQSRSSNTGLPLHAGQSVESPPVPTGDPTPSPSAVQAEDGQSARNTSHSEVQPGDSASSPDANQRPRIGSSSPNTGLPLHSGQSVGSPDPTPSPLVAQAEDGQSAGGTSHSEVQPSASASSPAANQQLGISSSTSDTGLPLHSGQSVGSPDPTPSPSAAQAAEDGQSARGTSQGEVQSGASTLLKRWKAWAKSKLTRRRKRSKTPRR